MTTEIRNERRLVVPILLSLAILAIGVGAVIEPDEVPRVSGGLLITGSLIMLAGFSRATWRLR